MGERSDVGDDVRAGPAGTTPAATGRFEARTGEIADELTAALAAVLAGARVARSTPWRSHVANDIERPAGDAGAAAEAQDLDRIAARLEALIDRRRDGGAATPGVRDEGPCGEHDARRARWNSAADEVRDVMDVLRLALEAGDAAEHEGCPQPHHGPATEAGRRP